MGSSYKTDFLNLNHWTAEDSPKRLDFVEDNEKVDLAFKEHLGDTESHVTEQERLLWGGGTSGGGIITGTYLGNNNKQTITMEKAPDFLVVFSTDRIGANYTALSKQSGTYMGFATQTGNSPGITLNAKSFVVETNVYPNKFPDSFNLNDVNINYMYVGFCF